MPKSYTVTDGRLLLKLTVAPEGGFVVTSPLHPELVTEAETLPDAFAMARDAIHALMKSGEKLHHGRIARASIRSRFKCHSSKSQVLR